MPNSHNLAVLQQVIAGEQAENEARRCMFNALTQKMTAYSEGQGPEPSIEDFLKWRDSVALVNFEKKLDSDFSELTP